jgi:hypothetical protein
MSQNGGFRSSLNVVVAVGNGNKTGADACEISPASVTAAITVGSNANKTDNKSFQ